MQGQLAQLTQQNAELRMENMNDKMNFAAKLTDQITKRHTAEMARAAESENSASQEFIAKLDSVGQMMDNFISAMQMGADPNMLAAAATRAVEMSSRNVRSGPDFGQSMQLLEQSSITGNSDVNNMLEEVLPGGMPATPSTQQGQPPMPSAPPTNGAQQP
jgi:hypothetical protein